MGQALAWPRTENAAPDDGHGIFFRLKKALLFEKRSKNFCPLASALNQ